MCDVVVCKVGWLNSKFRTLWQSASVLYIVAKCISRSSWFLLRWLVQIWPRKLDLPMKVRCWLAGWSLLHCYYLQFWIHMCFFAMVGRPRSFRALLHVDDIMCVHVHVQQLEPMMMLSQSTGPVSSRLAEQYPPTTDVYWPQTVSDHLYRSLLGHDHAAMTRYRSVFLCRQDVKTTGFSFWLGDSTESDLGVSLFTTWHYACVVYAVAMCLSLCLCLSLHLSQACIVPKCYTFHHANSAPEYTRDSSFLMPKIVVKFECNVQQRCWIQVG